MGKNEDMVELTHLEKIGKDCWKFQTKYNASFDAVFENLKKAHVFEAKMVYPFGEFEYHLINDQGIWLLSHCFSNWTEMYAQATKKSPWEQAWQKKQEQFICDYCEEKILLVYKFCPECQHYFHTKCYYEHIGEEPEQGEVSEQDEMTCASCGVDGFNDLVFCRECNGGNGRWLCSPCYANVTHIHSPAYKAKQQEKRDSKKCPHCQREYGPSYPWVFCAECKQQICLKCSAFHQETHAQSYGSYTRQQSGNMNKEDLDDLLKKMFGYSRQQSYFYEDDSYTFRQHYTHQQSWSNSQQSQQQTRTQSASSELEMAFKVLNLSTRATVQEVKRAFRRQAKTAHPDTGGSEQAFKELNAAYQLALAHAERNER